ncbi:MAG: 4Fe-4S dicluster domain-containing protein [Methanomassiliicoccales archaeon]|nr:4Fe-4S dicluster domain-containing protein [Methanomassiliicoccales archaeon]NYT14392.1 4Fe-4S dicluster domain-containing protein [Methanomassiliicoccales archaeon]
MQDHDRISSKLDDMKIDSYSGFQKCIQCGRCSASCPAALIYEDFTPRDIMRRLMMGEVENLVAGNEIWRCGQCFSCAARCPRDNSVANAILALRSQSLQRMPLNNEIRQIEASLKKNLYETGETILPSTLLLPLENLGGRTRERCFDNSKRKERLGYAGDTARATPLPKDALIEVRILLEKTGFR